MTGRKLATPGAVMILAGAFLLYWGLREFGVVGGQPASVASSSSSVNPSPILSRSA